MTSGKMQAGFQTGRSSRKGGPGFAVVAATMMLALMPAVSGCTRTSDGTIEPIVPLTLDAMPPLRPIGWGRTSVPQQQTTLAATAFPDAPAAPQRRTYGKRVSRDATAVPRFGIVTKPILRSAAEQPAKAITCRETVGTSGKKRVVCD
jgi:hypothetical protein